MASFFPTIAPTTSRNRSLAGMDIVFTDQKIILALCGNKNFNWAAYQMPFVFTVSPQEELVAPPGWSYMVKPKIFHREVGGSTTGVYALGLLSPSSLVCRPDTLPTMIQQPWAPMDSLLNSVVSAAPLQVALRQQLEENPLRLQGSAPVVRVGGLIHPRGLAPQHIGRLKVIVPCVFNAGKLGVRQLTTAELAGLSDVPILLIDYLTKRLGSEGEALLQDCCAGHPSKVLLQGSDYLLSTFFRGGFGVGVNSIGANSSSAKNCKASQRTAEEDTDQTKDSRFLYIHQARLLASTSSADEDLEITDLAAVVKQEGQKADDAPVPIHMWDVMYLRGRVAMGAGEQFNLWKLMSTWNNSGLMVTVPKASDPRDCNFSDTQLTEEIQLPRWRWALMKIRAAALRYWRRRVTRSFFESIHESLTIGLWKKPNGGPTAWIEPMGGRAWVRDRRNRRIEVFRPPFVWKGENQNAQHRSRDLYKKSWKLQREHSADVCRTFEVGADCVYRSANSLWWEWREGSALLFWRWPKSHFHWARDGQPHYVIGDLPRFREPQRKPRTEEVRIKVVEKFGKVRRKRYVDVGEVESITHVFDVPKNLDIRLVYDGTSSGLNAALWAPRFGLPTLDDTLRSLLPHYFQCDLDVGEMFLCFNLGLNLRKYAGVDITHMRNTNPETQEEWERGRVRKFERWTRNFMGMRDSPYRSIQLMLMTKWMAYGDRLDKDNPYQWERVELNLPGSEDYDPTLPWVMKVRSDGHLACEIYIYVDDCRVTGWCKLECWRAVRKLSTILNYLGLQDAFRKRTEPVVDPGPWSGGVTSTALRVLVTVTIEKWRKTRALVEELDLMIRQNSRKIPRKRLEQIRGFLNYVTRTYRWMSPYIKGLHLTIDGWRKDRDMDGYRKFVNEAAIKEAEKDMAAGREVDLDAFHVKEEVVGKEQKPPEFVEGKARLLSDVAALMKLTKADTPAVQQCRVGELLVAYLMGDASGDGFGNGIWDSKGVEFEAGNWKEDLKHKSSNFRESNNLVTKVEALADEGKLKDRELFIFTDNTTFEGTFYKGHSKSSKEITELILRLRVIERKYGAIIHVFHISGTRMKMAGVDGLSRGDCLEGIMAGMNPWSTIPLNEDANERTNGRVEEWIRSWWTDEKGKPWCQVVPNGVQYESSKLEKLEPEDWFNLKEIKGHRLWIPPPAAMSTVMEVFGEDRIINPHLTHIFAIPRLMTNLWRKRLFRNADLKFYVTPGAPFWPRSMHEPLTVVVILPLAHVENYRGPWIAKDTPQAKQLGEKLDTQFKDPGEYGRAECHDLESSVFSVWEDEQRWSRDLLSQFLHEQVKFPPVSSGLLRGMLPGLRGLPISDPEDSGGRRGGGKRVRDGGD